ncbi:MULTISPECIES: non-oxidative hydroxyarylic acid decarboxylases subunit B [unclassified Paenibacillus]|uniref:non-oxidative hydroxyarylic acid decarboxylases subunit B n=1 Tax=unclassified Paenibacillus TaxID=185978 RepID=UPI001AE1ADB0|nr:MULTISPECIES: non-oxidative hydroxyarylic acid decarboxylases subunit B [unclassified Paenibacillus]MBP1154066.1 4-hydroxy-3-polyprenylbenzoate decarboxylase [Paenibacillus sp. PvP091]MBP1170549.1 4-hydroxy-3-polyprenylbenzoate decarboxylase [Paenibacillus sp. PvR098]MBP2441577.1 4-hydroxy-3-polyprenylbenzoate decarboxylase [Paenibacillus sp. PvP052]
MRIIVGISGATGAIYGIRILEALREQGVETHLVMSKWAETTITLETNYSVSEVSKLASVVHSPMNQAASISSGSFRVDGMIIAPCSMKTLAAIRIGYADGLLARAADVILKERKKLVMLTRETPLNDIHLENMLALSRMGAVILPPVPAFYNKPSSIDDMVNHIVARTLDQFDISNTLTKRWKDHKIVHEGV